MEADGLLKVCWDYRRREALVGDFGTAQSRDLAAVLGIRNARQNSLRYWAWSLGRLAGHLEI